jgi:hypothetical protein
MENLKQKEHRKTNNLKIKEDTTPHGNAYSHGNKRRNYVANETDE